MDKISSKSKFSKLRSSSLVPHGWDNTVRTLSISESAEAGRSLAHSFATDKMSRYVLDGEDMASLTDEQRWKIHVDMMISMVSAHIYKGVVTAIGSDYDAVALWLPPGKDMDDWWTVFRSGLWKLWFRLSATGRKRYFEQDVLDDVKEEIMGKRDSECYYLVYIGTKPNARGKGYAGKLLRHMIAKADSENRPIYLESTEEHNNSYYAKFGFEVKREVVFNHNAEPIKLWSMVREPQPTKPACPTAPTLVQSVSGSVMT